MRLAILLRSMFVLSLLMPTLVLSSTLTPSDKIKLDSLSVKCSDPGADCPMVPSENVLEVVYLEKDDEYSLSGESVQLAKEDGLLVSISEPDLDAEPDGASNNSEKMMEKNYFFPMSKVELSPDSQFYHCKNGSENSLDFDFDPQSIGLDQSSVDQYFSNSFQATSFICKCFWMPKYAFTELGIDKKGKGKGPDTPEEDTPITDILFPNEPTLYPPSTPTNPPKTSIFPPPPYLLFPPMTPDYYPPYNPVPPNPPETVAPVPVFGKCGMIPWKCIYDYFTK